MNKSKMLGIYYLLRDRCPACGSTGNGPCGICYNDPDYFEYKSGKQTLYWRWQNELKMQKLFAEIDANFEYEQNKTATK